MRPTVSSSHGLLQLFPPPEAFPFTFTFSLLNDYYYLDVTLLYFHSVTLQYGRPLTNRRSVGLDFHVHSSHLEVTCSRPVCEVFLLTYRHGCHTRHLTILTSRQLYSLHQIHQVVA